MAIPKKALRVLSRWRKKGIFKNKSFFYLFNSTLDYQCICTFQKYHIDAIFRKKIKNHCFTTMFAKLHIKSQ